MFVSPKTSTGYFKLFSFNYWRVTFLFNVEYHPFLSIASSVYFGDKRF